MPAIPWCDKLIIGGVLWGVVCLWRVRYARKRLPDLAPIPIACIMMGTIIISLDIVSFRVRPDIAAAWTATWGRIPWWDRILAGAAVAGSLFYWRRAEWANLRQACAGGTFIFAVWTQQSLVHAGPLEGLGWAERPLDAMVCLSIVWLLGESIRARAKTSRPREGIAEKAAGGSPADTSI